MRFPKVVSHVTIIIDTRGGSRKNEREGLVERGMQMPYYESNLAICVSQHTIASLSAHALK